MGWKRLLLLLSIIFVPMMDCITTQNPDLYRTGEVLNGRGWLEMTAGQKAIYLTGLDEGMRWMWHNLFTEQPAIRQAARKAYESVLPVGFATGEIIGELNRFYADTANSRVPIVLALKIAKARFEGASDEEIAKLTAAARKEVVDWPTPDRR